MAKITRRGLIKQTAIGAGAAGVIAAVAVEAPNLLAASSHSDQVQAALAPASSSDPIVAAVSNPATGQISLMIGSREVVFTDPALVNSLLRKAGL